MTDKPAPREVEIVHPDYQPSKAELEEDFGWTPPPWTRSRSP